jgi:nicotinate dehydrogenase subunit B
VSAETSRRGFLFGAGALAVGFSFLGSGPSSAAPGQAASAAQAKAAAADGSIRVFDANGTATDSDSWLILTPKAITVYSGKVELGTGTQTALTQIVVEELRLGVADVEYVQGDTVLSVGQGTTAGSKTIQEGGVQLREAAATAYHELLGRAAAHFGVDASKISAKDGFFQVTGGSSAQVSYATLLHSDTSVVPLDEKAPLVSPSDYKVVGTEQPRVDLPAKLDATFRYMHDIAPQGVMHGRVVRPTGRNSRNPVIGNLDRAKAIEGFVDVVQHDRFIGVLASTEWAASVAADPKTGITVTWDDGPKMVAQQDLPTALRDPANHYKTVVEIDGNVDPILSSADNVVTAQYDTPFQMHGSMGAATGVADVRAEPDPDTGIQATIWSATQNVTNLRGAIAQLLKLDVSRVHVIYEEGSGCYGHNGADDACADAALLSQAVHKPVRVQWTRMDENGWEPLGPAQAHDMKGSVDANGITAWSHLNYALTCGSRPSANNAGSLLAGALSGTLPDPLPNTSVDSSGRNCPITYDIPQRVEARLNKSFETTGPTSATPSSPLTYRFPRSTALRSLGGFSNSFTNESFFDELAHAGNHDPLELRISSLKDPRAVAVCEALRPAWQGRPKGGDGTGAGVAFQQYEVKYAYAAAYVEVTVDSSTGQVRVGRVVIAHDCGLIVNPDGLRNQIQGNVVQGVSRTLIEEVGYTDDRVTTVVWQTSSFHPGKQYDVVRFNQVPTIETILINHTDQPPLGAGEPGIGVMPGAIGNAVYAAIGKRLRTTPFTPDRVKAALAG